jgi:AGCS family alanine or glycine:cation symporter
MPWTQQIEKALNAFAAFMWGPPLVVLLVGGGLFFMVYSRARPYRFFPHAVAVLRGRYNDPRDEGDISHFQALSTALSGTLGMGNVAGVAVAIGLGGPGAVFWMWLTAVVGVATKFFTATLAVMYRGPDSRGHLQGGPMYVIREGLGPRWRPLAYLFALAALIGTTPVFQINQLVEILQDTLAEPMGWASEDSHFAFDLITGLILAGVVLTVILGRVQRVGRVTAILVPTMVVAYLLVTFGVLIDHAERIPGALALIVTDAFTGTAAAGGALGSVIVMGVRRGAFSNEAGIGTESMAHGAARTNEPVREGLVAMIGPVIDTLLVCTCTALTILVTDVWRSGEEDGVIMTLNAFRAALPEAGEGLLAAMVVMLGLSTVFSFWYYGAKCLGFLIGAEHQHHYIWVYCVLVVLGAVMSLDMVVGFVDGMYALMALPTMISALVLAPRVMRASHDYRDRFLR